MYLFYRARVEQSAKTYPNATQERRALIATRLHGSDGIFSQREVVYSYVVDDSQLTYQVSMFPILPRSPESLSSSLICSRSTIPKKKKKNDIFLGMSISSLQIPRIERIKMNSKMSPRQCKKSLKKMGLNSILILTKKGAV